MSCWCRLRGRSMREILLLVIVLSLLSLYITYHLGTPVVEKQVTPGKPPWLNGHLDSEGKSIWMQLKENRGKGFGIRLHKLLHELEDKLLLNRRLRPGVAVIRGQKGVINRDLPLYQRALLKHSFSINAPSSYRRHHLILKNGSVFYGTEDSSFKRASSDPEEWTLLLCMTFTDGDTSSCLERASYAHLQPYQRVNRVPGIRNSLWRKDGFCLTMSEARQLPAARRSHLSPMCFVLPGQIEQFLHVADALGEDAHWIVKPLTAGGSLELVGSLEAYGKLKVKEYSRQRPVLVQQMFPHPLLVFGYPVSLRVYVLLTSVSPLRAYLFNEGLVHFRHDHTKGFRKVMNRTWLLSQLWHYLARNYAQHSVRTALLNLQAAIVQTLLIAEAMIATHVAGLPSGDTKYKCQHCFQLLGFDIIFNATLHAVVLEVNGQPNLQENHRSDGWAVNSVKRSLIDNLLGLLYSGGSVAREVAEAIEECAENTGIMGINCLISHDLCLTQDDLIFLLETRRESLSKGGFRQLYPSLGAERYSSLIRDLDYLLVTQRAPAVPEFTRDSSHHATADLHSLLIRLERYYSRQIVDDDYSDSGMEDSAIWMKSNITGISRMPQELLELNSYNPKYVSQDILSRPPCNEDPVTMPYLLTIQSDPPLNLTPCFSPLVVDYSAHVPYEQLLITVWAFAQNCQSEARIDDKFGPSQPTNYTLGLGENRLSFLVVDIRHTEPWVINTYSLTVHRATPIDTEAQFNPSMEHEVCGLKQECELRVLPTEPCGLQRESSLNWTSYLSYNNDLPVCNQGDAPGQWVLPCQSCSEKSSCFWKMAQWIPHSCHYEYVSKHNLSDCLAGKKLLFLGDSTNRGIMHYVMERLNGTLGEWDKTHHIKLYPNLNGGRTAISFAYYPQFWLPTNERPVLDKALYQLIHRSRPLENNTNTVLIVGGVHWLATQHLHMVLRALHREGLEGIRLAMKTLGSGFHLPVDGVHCLSQSEQRKLLLHSRGLAEFAKHYDFEVIDTFNITVSRFRDFLQGKCACHFHKVVPVQDENGRDFRYHVEGPVNAVYSEILISRICAKR